MPQPPIKSKTMFLRHHDWWCCHDRRLSIAYFLWIVNIFQFSVSKFSVLNKKGEIKCKLHSSHPFLVDDSILYERYEFLRFYARALSDQGLETSPCCPRSALLRMMRNTTVVIKDTQTVPSASPELIRSVSPNVVPICADSPDKSAVMV